MRLSAREQWRAAASVRRWTLCRAARRQLDAAPRLRHTSTPNPARPDSRAGVVAAEHVHFSICYRIATSNTSASLLPDPRVSIPSWALVRPFLAGVPTEPPRCSWASLPRRPMLVPNTCPPQHLASYCRAACRRAGLDRTPAMAARAASTSTLTHRLTHPDSLPRRPVILRASACVITFPSRRTDRRQHRPFYWY